MKITIVCVGKVKEKFFREAVSEYEKRLSRYCRFDIVEVADEKTPEGAGSLLEEQIREINGKRLSSEELARWMEKLTVGGTSHIMFVIGGSLGLHESVSRRADLRLSFSDMTFPHQLMRVILTEQVYRAFRIIHGEPYHK